MNSIKIVLIRFQNVISAFEIEAFRGAVINELENKNILFHNHTADGKGFRYSYPLIQYKRINKKAALLCIQEGTEAIVDFFNESNLDLNIKGRVTKFEIETINAYNCRIQIWNSMVKYTIRKWMALNQDNYEIYEQLESVAEKSSFLENILIGNILSFAKGVDVFFDKQVECKITWLSEPQITTYKNVRMTIFDADFITNVSIPDYVGLGKGVSIGYGMTVRRKDKK